MYAEALAKSMAAGGEISFDEKLTSIDTLDVLTDIDIKVLGYFVPGYRIQVSQMLSSGAPWNQLAGPLGKLLVSISKLESRGLRLKLRPRTSFSGGRAMLIIGLIAGDEKRLKLRLLAKLS